MNIVIIGAGQLGSRHLQGLALVEQSLNIYLVDPSEKSLKTCEERFNQVDNFKNKILHFNTDIAQLPKEIELAIIATTSKYRLSSLKLLLEKVSVKYLILEKFLFPFKEDYEIADKLIKKSKTKSYVNCGRRTFTSYKALKEMISGERFELKIIGDKWNLGSNAIHLVDLFNFLNDCSEITFDYDNSTLTPIESKHEGYTELLGNIRGADVKGNSLELICNMGKEIKVEIELTVNNSKCIINETEQIITYENKTESFLIPYQSQMTNVVFNQLLQNDKCDLIGFEESAQLHLKLLHLFNEVTGKKEGVIVT